MVSSGGCYLDGFGSTVRGDATLRRFEHPPANVVYRQGQLNFGLGEKVSRINLRHAFEESKKEECEAAQDRITTRPEGPRFQGTSELMNKLMKQRAEEEAKEEERRVQHYKDALAGNLRQLPVFQTSHDNPLIPLPAESGSGENSTQADAHRSLKSPQDILRARSLNSNLDLSSCLPLVDSLPPVSAAALEAQAQELKRQQEMKELEQQLMNMYPHGVPKRIQMEMMQMGLMLPGFGCTK